MKRTLKLMWAGFASTTTLSMMFLDWQGELSLPTTVGHAEQAQATLVVTTDAAASSSRFGPSPNMSVDQLVIQLAR
jgi:hypothetical protein